MFPAFHLLFIAQIGQLQFRRFRLADRIADFLMEQMGVILITAGCRHAPVGVPAELRRRSVPHDAVADDHDLFDLLRLHSGEHQCGTDEQ